MSKKIEKLYAYVAVKNDQEGILASKVGEEWMPFVCSDYYRILKFEDIAKKIGNETNSDIKLLSFSVRNELKTITSKESKK